MPVQVDNRSSPPGGGRRRDALPPGPRGPAVLNTALLMRRPLQSLIGWRRRYGDLVTVPLLVFGTGVYVSDLDGIRSLLTGDQSDLHAGEANAPLATSTSAPMSSRCCCGPATRMAGR
jgi:hypothetical protein